MDVRRVLDIMWNEKRFGEARRDCEVRAMWLVQLIEDREGKR